MSVTWGTPPIKPDPVVCLVAFYTPLPPFVWKANHSNSNKKCSICKTLTRGVLIEISTGKKKTVCATCVKAEAADAAA
jgi:hypothetical protein